MKRVFYYSGHQLTVFHFHNDNRAASYNFNPDEAGLNKFKHYLLATHNTPVRLLVDLIEEDFKKDTLPHVSSTDKKFIVNRLISRQYRKSKDYVYYKIIGRLKTGRQDDILLYSVLSNPQILAPWLSILSECKTTVSGIWSLPLLSNNLFKQLKLSYTNALLVSQQTPNNLRQTFFKNGIIENSRSGVINLKDESLGEHIVNQVEQTLHFLANQRHMDYDDNVDIHIICREDDISDIHSQCVNSRVRNFHYYSIADIIKLTGCHNQFSNQDDCPRLQYCHGIFAYICAQKLCLHGHYGNTSLFSHYYQYIISKCLITLSLAIVIVASLFSASYLTDIVTIDAEITMLKVQTDGVNNDYEKKFLRHSKILNNANLMKSSVLLNEKIIKIQQLSPQNFIADISRIFTLSGVQNTHISKINWKQLQSNNFPDTNIQHITPLNYSISLPLNQYALIHGYIQVSKSSLKESVNTINTLVYALKNHPRTIRVRIKKMPMDILSNSSIESEGGVEIHTNLNSDKHKGHFEIELVMKGYAT